MAEKQEKQVRTETVERDRYTEPREREDADHQDAGQVYTERANDEQEKADKAADKND